MSMSDGDRDTKMNEMATIAAEEFCTKHYSPTATRERIKENPEMYLEQTIPYLTVRTLHRQGEALDRHEKALDRHEKALDSLKADSRWIKWFAIISGLLTFVLVGLTIILALYACRLDTLTQSLQPKASPTPSPTATATP
jgi:hypothetical protein